MNILFMGTPDFAAGILEAILASDEHKVVAVITQPDRPKGRSGEAIAPPVKKLAVSAGIRVFQPVKIKEKEEVEKLKKIDADIYVVAAFGQILSKEILDIPRYGCINVHASLLPEYRGAAPIQWAIADGRKTTGVTIQQMNEGVDTGDIITSSEVDIAADETGESLFEKLMICGKGLIVETLDLIEAGKATHTPQDESKATHAKMLKKEMGCVDFMRPADEIERLIRAFTPWPGGYTYLDGKMLKIKKCETAEGRGVPGTVIKITKDGIYVACGKNALLITRIQAEGKKEMPVHDFLLGNSIKEGTVLGRAKEKEGE